MSTNDAVLNGLKERLKPETQVLSARMSAFVAFVFDEKWTVPSLDTLTITSDGIVLTDNANVVIGNAEDLICNFRGALEFVGASQEEVNAFFAAFRARMGRNDWRRTMGYRCEEDQYVNA